MCVVKDYFVAIVRVCSLAGQALHYISSICVCECE
jgi:hypothetical protein